MSRLKSKGFELLNVSVDEDRAALVGLIAASGFPGVHTWDPKGRDNPVSKLYNVRLLPTTYLIDNKGVIRKRDPQMGALVDEIMAVMKN